jgi:hypothetical protein
VAIAGLVAGALTLPFLLADTHAFLYSLVEVQNRLPFRTEGLTYLVWWWRMSGTVLPTWIGLAAAIVAAAFGLWRAPRTPLGFSVATALTLVVLFAFNRAAFANYYFFILGLLLVGVAVGWREDEGPGRRSEPSQAALAADRPAA